MANNIVKYVLDLETKQAQKNLKKLSGEAQTFGPKAKKSTSEASAGFSKLKGSVHLVASSFLELTSAFKTVIDASYEFTVTAVNNINHLNDLSNKSGISAKALQAVTLAFEASGQSASSAEIAMEALPRRFSQIRKEGTEANELLKNLGIDPKFKNNEELLKNIIEVIQQTGDSSARAQIAVDLFGRSGTKMVQAFADTASLISFTNITSQFGVNAKKGANSAAEFQKSIATLKTVMRGARDTIVQSTGAMGFFQSAIRTGVFSVIFASESIKHFQGELKTLGNILMILISRTLLPAFKAIAGVTPMMSIAFQALEKTVRKGMDIFGKPVQLVKFETKLTMAKNAALKAVESLDALNDVTQKNDNVTKRAQQALKNKNKTNEEGNKTNKKATQEIDKLNKAREREQKKLTDLINNYNDQIVTLKQAEKAVIKLNRSFDALKMPKDELDAFSQKLKLIADQNFIKKIDDDIKQAFADIDQIQIDIKAGTSSMRNSLMNEAFKFGNALAGAIAGQAEGMAVLAEKFTSSLGLGEGLGSNIVGSIGMFSGLGQGFMQAGERAVQEKEEELGRPLTATEQKAIMKQASLEDARLRVENFVEGFAYFIELLPEILINVLPGAIARGIVGLLRAIFNLPQNITNSIARWWASQKDNWTEGLGNFFQGVGDTFVEGVTLGFADTETFDGTYRSGGKIKSGRSGLKFTGPQKQGMALLHENEFVVPASGQKPQTVARQMRQGNGITINVSGMIVESNAVDQIVREIERRYSAFGTSTSALFGG